MAGQHRESNLTGQILAVPKLPVTLHRPLWLKNPTTGFCTFNYDPGEWVDIDDPVARFTVASPTFGAHIATPVYSPLSGRLFRCYDIPFGASTGVKHDPTNYFFLIEIQEGEYVPPTLRNTYRQFCHDLSESREALLQQCRDGSFTPWSDVEVELVIEKILSTPPIILPKSIFL